MDINYHFPQPGTTRTMHFDICRAKSKHVKTSWLSVSLTTFQSRGTARFSAQRVNVYVLRYLQCVLDLYHREIKWYFGFGRWKSLTFSVIITHCNFSSLSTTQLIGLQGWKGQCLTWQWVLFQTATGNWLQRQPRTWHCLRSFLIPHIVYTYK